jgi:Acyclic terpene utilisation family protein AtuA
MSDRMLIGAGAGYSGDRVDAPIAVVHDLQAAGERSAIIFETLGERTLAAAQLHRRQNPGLGYEPKLAELLRPVLKDCVESNIPIIGNFGAANPSSASEIIADLSAQNWRGERRRHARCRRPFNLARMLPRLTRRKALGLGKCLSWRGADR